MDLLSQARAALRQGDKSTAGSLIKDALRQNPRDPAAWLLMSGVVESPDQQRDCLRRVLALDPANAAAQRGLATLNAAPWPDVNQPSRDSAPAQPAWQPPAPMPPPAYAAPPAREPLGSQPPSAGQHIPAGPPDAGSPAPFATQALPTQSFGAAQGAPAPSPWPAGPSAPPAGSPATPAYATPLIDYGAYGAPQQSPYGAPPAAAYAPALAGEYGGYVGAPVKRRSPLTVIVIALLSVALLAICMIGGLTLLGSQVGPPPPTPKVSAQDRMTAMLNDTFALMLNPRFLDPDTMEAEAKPLERYVSKDGRKAFIRGLRISLLGQDLDAFKEISPRVQRMTVEHMTYRVVEQTSRTISIQITGGNLIIVLKNGQWVRQPMGSDFKGTWTYINDGGVWYLNDYDE